MKTTVAILAALTLSACTYDPARIQSPNQKINADKHIDIFDSKQPDKPYTEIGRTSVTRNTSQTDRLYDDLRQKARRADADAVIVKSTTTNAGNVLIGGTTSIDAILVKWLP